MKQTLVRLNLYTGLLILISSFVLLGLKIPFIKTWYYSFAWWGFILFLDSVNFRRTHSSLIYDSGKKLFFWMFISVSVWLVFELFNLRLENWSYHHLPSNLSERWLGYFVAFATVIPALKELSHFFRSFLEGKNIHLFRFHVTPTFLWMSISGGIVCIILILFWPQVFFPLVWLCFIFLLEPINYKLNNPTLIRNMERKEWTTIWSWMLGGLAAGILWEFWNYWPGSHWEYSLPYLDFGRIFQMPFLGYLGFIPFALEIFAIFQITSYVYQRIKEKIVLQSFLYILLILFDLGVFYLIDKFTLLQ